MADAEPKTGRGKLAKDLMGTDGRKPLAPCTEASLGKASGVCANISAPLIDKANEEPKTPEGKAGKFFEDDGRRNVAPCAGACLNEPNGVCAEAFASPKKKRP